MRISIKRIEERIKVINSLTNNEYEIKLYKTTGCGLDISINGIYQAELVNGFDKNNTIKHFTNKELMNFLNKQFNKLLLRKDK